MITYTVENLPGKKKLPLWARTTIRTDDGKLWLPAILVGSEARVVLMAGWDGTPLMEHQKHIFVQAEWIKRECPECAEIIEKVIRRSAELDADANS
jgi:hypothetical protein